MLHQPTLEKLEAMRLHGMAQAWRELAKSEQPAELSFEERMALLVDRQFAWRQNEAFEARLRRAKLRANACVEDIDYRAARGLDKTVIRALAQKSAWAEQHENIFVLGPTGVGKCFVACADTRPCTCALRRYSVIWPSRMRTAVCAACWRGSAVSTCW